MKQIVFSKTGGPDVLEWIESEIPSPARGEVLIRHTAIGLNYIDTYHRSGLYPVPLPSPIGLEAAGVIEAVGDDVAGYSVGERIAYPTGPLGAYSEMRTIPANKVVKIPDAISDEDAAALLLKGCTVEYLTYRTYAVQEGDTVLFHAAAGGVGLIACQWLSARGVTIIGTAGGPEKCKLAQANGCHHIIDYRAGDFEVQVMDITGDKGVPVVYDSVGKDTFSGSINCLQRRGMMVSFGNATGPVDPVPPGLLGQKGSLFLTRPSLLDYAATPEDLRLASDRVFKAIEAGHIKSNINQRFALKDAVKAHKALEARETTGQTLLIP